MSSGTVNLTRGGISAQGTSPSFPSVASPTGGVGSDFSSMLQEMIRNKWEEKQRRMADEEALSRARLGREQPEEQLRLQDPGAVQAVTGRYPATTDGAWVRECGGLQRADGSAGAASDGSDGERPTGRNAAQGSDAETPGGDESGADEAIHDRHF